MSMDIQKSKRLLREEMRRCRDALGEERRLVAEEAFFKKVQSLCEGYDTVISYSSFGSELSTLRLNLFLQGCGKLYLPKIIGEELQIFRVEDASRQLKKHAYGFDEPDPLHCVEWLLDSRALMVVPGLAFDQRGFRLGYGKGYYDRLISARKGAIDPLGVGFEEQRVQEVPVSANDMPLAWIFLF